jgi:hypothetical protein
MWNVRATRVVIPRHVFPSVHFICTAPEYTDPMHDSAYGTYGSMIHLGQVSEPYRLPSNKSNMVALTTASLGISPVHTKAVHSTGLTWNQSRINEHTLVKILSTHMRTCIYSKLIISGAEHLKRTNTEVFRSKFVFCITSTFFSLSKNYLKI